MSAKKAPTGISGKDLQRERGNAKKTTSKSTTSLELRALSFAAWHGLAWPQQALVLKMFGDFSISAMQGGPSVGSQLTVQEVTGQEGAFQGSPFTVNNYNCPFSS